jgi:hypothetical protein
MFWKLDMFLSSVKGREAPTLFGALERVIEVAVSKGPNRLGG